MNLTKKSSYGLIAALELARHSQASPQSATAIAEQYSLPVSFIEKILHELRHAGIIRSKQGRAGGYYLARSPEQISVRDVLEALGESLDLVGCLNSESHCDLTDCCPTQSAWRHIDTRFKGLLDSLSLQSLLHSDAGFGKSS
ncbi:Rrf2 family transcriptional regulator [Candidatus Bipolaricaulota bacterium]|nr:Rrf2 family transcriptional regulator [Candidatus Bipolaricaulota bacterium]